jgi:hypothetical protein
MRLNKAILVLSLFLLLYLLADALSYIDFAASKNHALIVAEEKEIEAIQNIDSIKQKTEIYLDRIDQGRRDNSSRSTINFWLLSVLIFSQVLLLSRNRINNTSKTN